MLSVWLTQFRVFMEHLRNHTVSSNVCYDKWDALFGTDEGWTKRCFRSNTKGWSCLKLLFSCITINVHFPVKRALSRGLIFSLLFCCWCKIIWSKKIKRIHKKNLALIMHMYLILISCEKLQFSAILFLFFL